MESITAQNNETAQSAGLENNEECFEGFGDDSSTKYYTTTQRSTRTGNNDLFCTFPLPKIIEALMTYLASEIQGAALVDVLHKFDEFKRNIECDNLTVNFVDLCKNIQDTINNDVERYATDSGYYLQQEKMAFAHRHNRDTANILSNEDILKLPLVSKLVETSEELKYQNKRLSNQIGSLQLQICDSEDANNQLIKENEELKAVVNNLNSRFYEKTEMKDDRIKQLQSRLDFRAESLTDAKEKELKILAEKLRKCDLQLNRFRTKLEEVQIEKEELEMQLESEKDARVGAESRLDKKENEMKEILEKLQETEFESVNNRKMLEEALQNEAALQITLQMKTEHLSRLEKDVVKLQNELKLRNNRELNREETLPHETEDLRDFDMTAFWQSDMFETSQMTIETETDQNSGESPQEESTSQNYARFQRSASEIRMLLNTSTAVNSESLFAELLDERRCIKLRKRRGDESPSSDLLHPLESDVSSPSNCGKTVVASSCHTAPITLKQNMAKIKSKLSQLVWEKKILIFLSVIIVFICAFLFLAKVLRTPGCRSPNVGKFYFKLDEFLWMLTDPLTNPFVTVNPGVPARIQ